MQTSQAELKKQTWTEYEEVLNELFEDGVEEISYKDVAETIGKSADVIKKDFCGATYKGKFNPRHSKAFKDAGYVWNKGKITRKGHGDNE